MKVILWDWNGTLINDTPLNFDIFNVVRAERGYEPISLDHYRHIYKHPIRAMYHDSGIDLERDPYDALAQRWGQLYDERSKSVQLHDDAIDVLHALRSRGSRQAILSALPQTLLIEAVRDLGVQHLFESVNGTMDVLGHGKIDLGIRVAQQLNAGGQDITIVGDSSHDAEVAQELGARCILVSHGAQSEAKLLESGFPVVSSLRDVYSSLHGHPLPKGA